MKPIVITTPKYRSLPVELEGHEVTVEFDAKKQRDYPALGRHYRVLLDGERVGSITGHKETQYRKVGRLSNPTGKRMQWRGYAASEIGSGKAIGYPRDTRAEAALAVAQLWVQEGTG